jgi:hypothetical protein
LQFEISRASRKTLIQTNYDATACYDRIVPNLAMLVSKKFGVPHLNTLSNARTLQTQNIGFVQQRAWQKQATNILKNGPYMERAKAAGTPR